MTFAAEVLADSPLVYLKLNDTSGSTAADSSGNARPGAYVGGFTLNQPSMVASDPTDVSTLLNGTTGLITDTYNPFLAAGSRTFELIYNRRVNTADHDLFSSSSGVTMLRMASGGGTIKWFGDTGTSSADWTSASPGPGQNVLLDLLFNDSAHTAELYINGVSKGQLTGVATMAATTALRIGARGGSSEFFDGSIAHFSAYAGLLSAARIAAHYAALVAVPSTQVQVF